MPPRPPSHARRAAAATGCAHGTPSLATHTRTRCRPAPRSRPLCNRPLTTPCDRPLSTSGRHRASEPAWKELDRLQAAPASRTLKPSDAPWSAKAPVASAAARQSTALPHTTTPASAEMPAADAAATKRRVASSGSCPASHRALTASRRPSIRPRHNSPPPTAAANRLSATHTSALSSVCVRRCLASRLPRRCRPPVSRGSACVGDCTSASGHRFIVTSSRAALTAAALSVSAASRAASAAIAGEAA